LPACFHHPCFNREHKPKAADGETELAKVEKTITDLKRHEEKCRERMLVP